MLRTRIVAPSSATEDDTMVKPGGITEEGRSALCMALLPVWKPPSFNPPISSKLSQSQYCRPIHTPRGNAGLDDLRRSTDGLLSPLRVNATSGLVRPDTAPTILGSSSADRSLKPSRDNRQSYCKLQILTLEQFCKDKTNRGCHYYTH